MKKEEKFAREELKRKLDKLSWGLVSRLTDLALLQVYLGASLVMRSRYSSHFLYESFGSIQEKIDWEKIQRAFHNLRRQGLIEFVRQKTFYQPIITQQGKRRLANLLPVYESSRLWDGRLYLISYDIPESKRKDRDLLRDYLQKIGCGCLQASVWITPYNPKETLKDFVEEKGLKGLVIVSDVGKDGSIGEENIRDLIVKVYQLKELNERYQEFLEEFSKKGVAKEQVIFAYFSILQDDPQLPFELLPDGWLGEKAYNLYQKVSSTKS